MVHLDARPSSRTLHDRHVVVTGGAGFVGSWVCERLLAEGARVTCVDSFVTGSRDNLAHLEPEPCFGLVEADVSGDLAGAVAGALRERGTPGLVLHLASPASPEHYLRLPLETLRTGSLGTTRALELAHEHGARFLLASTSEVYGDPEEHPQREGYWGHVNPIGPRSVYDEAKRYAEAVTAAFRRHHGTDTAIARIFNTYGPRMATGDGRVVPNFVHQALTGRPLTVAGDGSQTRSLCYVEDTVEGLLRLALSGEAGPVNIGSEEECSVRDLAECVRELVGSDSPVRRIPLPEDDPRQRRPDLDRARALLDWEPRTPMRAGLLRTIEWMREAVTDSTRVPAVG